MADPHVGGGTGCCQRENAPQKRAGDPSLPGGWKAVLAGVWGEGPLPCRGEVRGAASVRNSVEGPQNLETGHATSSPTPVGSSHGQ